MKLDCLFVRGYFNIDILIFHVHKFIMCNAVKHSLNQRFHIWHFLHLSSLSYIHLYVVWLWKCFCLESLLELRVDFQEFLKWLSCSFWSEIILCTAEECSSLIDISWWILVNFMRICNCCMPLAEPRRVWSGGTYLPTFWKYESHSWSRFA